MEVTSFVGGQVPRFVGAAAGMRCAVARATLQPDDFVASLVERHVPVLLHGAASDVAATQRRLADSLPGVRLRQIRLYVRRGAGPTLGREWAFDETPLLLAHSTSAQVVSSLPQYLTVDEGEFPEVPGVLHVAVATCLWRHWATARDALHDMLVVVDSVAAVPGVLARQMPDGPRRITFVTPEGTAEEVGNSLAVAFDRPPPLGQTPALRARMAELFLSGVPSFAVTECREIRDKAEDAARLARQREDAAEQRKAAAAERAAVRAAAKPPAKKPREPTAQAADVQATGAPVERAPPGVVVEEEAGGGCGPPLQKRKLYHHRRGPGHCLRAISPQQWSRSHTCDHCTWPGKKPHQCPGTRAYRTRGTLRGPSRRRSHRGVASAPRERPPSHQHQLPSHCLQPHR